VGGGGDLRMLAVDQGRSLASSASIVSNADSHRTSSAVLTTAGAASSSTGASATAITQSSAQTQAQPRFAESRLEEAGKSLVAALSKSGDASVLTCPNNCAGFGVCANGQCFCNPGYSGDDCSVSVSCSNDCSGNGICKYGQCWCGPNYVGDDCSVFTNAAKQFPTGVLIGIIAVAAFFVGIIIGRKTLAQSGQKFVEGIHSMSSSRSELRAPIA